MKAREAVVAILGSDERSGMELTEYGKAEAKVDETLALDPYRHIILYDWDDEGHWEWVQTAPIQEIIDWAWPIREDELALLALEEATERWYELTEGGECTA